MTKIENEDYSRAKDDFKAKVFDEEKIKKIVDEAHFARLFNGWKGGAPKTLFDEVERISKKDKEFLKEETVPPLLSLLREIVAKVTEARNEAKTKIAKLVEAKRRVPVRLEKKEYASTSAVKALEKRVWGVETIAGREKSVFVNLRRLIVRAIPKKVVVRAKELDLVPYIAARKKAKWRLVSEKQFAAWTGTPKEGKELTKKQLAGIQEFAAALAKKKKRR